MILSHAFWSFLENKECKEKPEILLTNLILYLLKNYEEAKKVIKELTNLDVERFEQEKVVKKEKENAEKEEMSRPDIIGYDKNGKILLIIECKLNSGLTKNQPNSYLKSIGDKGKLIFLVPKDRIEYIRNRIKERVREDDLKRIKILSWIDLIKEIEKEARNSENKNLLSDLKQLKDLIEKIDRETMRPLTYEDLDPKNGRRILNFLEILKKCKRKMENELKEEIDMEGFTWGPKPNIGDIGFYFKFNQKNIGGYLHISFRRWVEYAKVKKVETPFWIKLNKLDDKNHPIGKHELVHSILERYEPDKTFEDFEDEDEKEKGTLYAITLTPGMEEEEIVNHIVNEIKKLADLFKDIK